MKINKFTYRPFLILFICLMSLKYGISQTHLIFHKSHSGSKVAFDYLRNHGLLDNTSCGEGLSYDDIDRIVKFDSVKVIGANQVVVFGRDVYKDQISDTNYIENIQMYESENDLKKKIKNNYGACVSDKTTFIKGENQPIRSKNENMIPAYLGGRHLTQLQTLLSEDSVRLVSLTNTTDIPIDFHVYLNSKITNYHVLLKPNESKRITMKLFQGIENRMSFYLLSDDQKCTKMMYASLKVTDTKSKSFVETRFDLGTFSSVQLSKNKVDKGSTIPTYIQPSNDPDNKGWWFAGITFLALLITGISLLRARLRWNF